MRKFFLALFALLLVVPAALFAQSAPAKKPSAPAAATKTHPRKATKGAEKVSFTEIVNRSQHRVAAIVREATQGIGVPIGSGFFINKEGFLVTNAHVIRDAEKLRSQGVAVGIYVPAFFKDTDYIVGMNAGQFELVAIDDNYDVAVLKTTALQRRPEFFQLSVTGIPPGTELAYTGYPLSQDFPVTVACRAATQGTHEPIAQTLGAGPKITGSFFLVDVPIHRGSSGSGMYLRQDGTVVGIASGSFTAPIETAQGPVTNVGTGAFGYVRPLKRLVEILDEKGIPYSKVPPLDQSVGR